MASDNVRRMFWKEQDKVERLGMELPATVLAPPRGFCPAVGCMDEGVTEIHSKPIAVRLAGSGALIGSDLLASKGVMAKIMKQYNLGLISHHHDCGAGTILVERLGRSAEEGDAAIESFANSVVSATGQRVSAVHAALHRSPHQHIAVCHYYAGTRVAPQLGGLPAGFVTSHFVLGKSTYGKHELAMAAGIAFGDHGFGDLFTEEAPYTIVVIAASKTQLDRYLAEAREVVAGLPDDIRERIAVRAFIGRNPVKL